MTDEVAGGRQDATPRDSGDPAASSADDFEALTDLAADDRLAMLEPAPPIARRLGMLLPVVVVSLAVHVGLFVLFALLVKEPPAIAEQQETSVEVVQEPPRPPEPKTAAKAAPVPPQPEEKPADAAKPQTAQEPPKQPELPKQPDPKQLEPEPAAKSDQPKPERPVPTAKAGPDAKRPEARAAASDKAADDAKTLQSLQDELASLKAQAAHLQVQQAINPESSTDLGLLPESFAAVALPSSSADGTDPVTYQQAVYSLIAKAKKSGALFVPGVAHVVFNVGARGELLDVTLDNPSGNAVVDKEAVAIVRRAAPFPPPPPGAPRSFPANISFVAGQ